MVRRARSTQLDMKAQAVVAGPELLQLAHDFNDVLAVILANASLGLASLGNDCEVARDLEAIERAVHRATDLTRRLIAITPANDD